MDRQLVAYILLVASASISLFKEMTCLGLDASQAITQGLLTMSPKTFDVVVKHLGTNVFPPNAILRLLRQGFLVKVQPKVEMLTCLVEHGFRTSEFDDEDTKKMRTPPLNADQYTEALA